MAVVTTPTMTRPDCSIVMVTFGRADLAEQALDALVEHTRDHRIEIIVVDNASPDGTADAIERSAHRVTLVRQAGNVGFGPANNIGVARATAPAVCLLNSDAFVSDGWLTPLLGELDELAASDDTRVVAAAPTLVFPDGRLQEAGPTIYREGHTYAFGCAESLDRPEHRFRRRVPFASAACLVLQRSAYLAVGGFDPKFAPAYCEDVDLCFRWNRRGWSTVYRPDSTVMHVRGASSDNASVAALLQRNTEILRDRWVAELARMPSYERLPEYPHRIVAARDHDVSERRLLIIPDLERLQSLVPIDTTGRASPRECRFTALLLTHVGAVEPDPASIDRWSIRGIEIAPRPLDLARWFEQRRFHYSDVFLDGSMLVDVQPHLDRTQPQARRHIT